MTSLITALPNALTPSSARAAKPSPAGRAAHFHRRCILKVHPSSSTTSHRKRVRRQRKQHHQAISDLCRAKTLHVTPTGSIPFAPQTKSSSFRSGGIAHRARITNSTAKRHLPRFETVRKRALCGVAAWRETRGGRSALVEKQSVIMCKILKYGKINLSISLGAQGMTALGTVAIRVGNGQAFPFRRRVQKMMTNSIFMKLRPQCSRR